MPKRTTSKPTQSELAILRVLWEKGPSTVRHVLEELEIERPTGYTTVLKTMQIMLGKGLLLRDESSKSHVYRPKLREGQTQKQLVKSLLDRAFNGSVEKLVMNALQAKRASKEELAQIRDLLDKYERDKDERHS